MIGHLTTIWNYDKLKKCYLQSVLEVTTAALPPVVMWSHFTLFGGKNHLLDKLDSDLQSCDLLNDQNDLLKTIIKMDIKLTLITWWLDLSQWLMTEIPGLCNILIDDQNCKTQGLFVLCRLNMHFELWNLV